MAGHIRSFFDQPHNQETLAALKEAGVTWQEEQVLSADEQPLNGQTWVLTGTLSGMTRDQAKEKLSSSVPRLLVVSPKTACVVAGEAAGSKLAKAEQLGVPVLDEEGLANLLREHGIEV